jgi:hypothetical protein
MGGERVFHVPLGDRDDMFMPECPPRVLTLCPLLFFDHHSLIATLWKRTPMAFTVRLQQVRNSVVLHTRFSSSASG